jgi:anti-sigma factor RsiW
MKPSSDEASVRAAIKAHAEVYSAPEGLREQILRSIHVSELASRGSVAAEARPMAARMIARAGSLLRAALGGANWPRYGAAFAMGVLVTSLGASYLSATQREHETLLALVADHSRAMVTDSAIEVVSTNTHTVKPWLSSKLGYSPVVIDLADADYPLQGGRRGFLGHQAIAVMVYGYKEHEIDLYAMPEKDARDLPSGSGLVDGFNTVGWKQEGIAYLAVSDAASARVEEFARILQRRQRAG